MIVNNAEIIRRAEAIAARAGGSWSDHLDAARNQASQPPLEKIVRKSPGDDDMRKKAAVAQLRHMPGVGNPDPDRRLEIGECETELGRVRVSISRDSISIHGVNTPLADIDADLRGVVATTAASFAAAETSLEQTEQRALIGFLTDAILRRHQFLNTAVKESKKRERFDS